MEQQIPSNNSNELVNSQEESDRPDARGDDPPAIQSARYLWLVVGLHLLIVLVNAVPLVFYFQRSWELEHYQFFPIALVVFGFIVWMRLERGTLRESRMVPFVCSVFLLLSLVCFLISLYQYNHYLPVVGAIFAIGSLLFCLQDKETNGSLLPTWLLLLPLIRIPLNFDITIISELQFFSAAFASNVLDFLGIPNYTPGTVIQVAQQGAESGVKSFDVERACSGVQSLYTLIFCTLTVAVWGRRSFVAGLILVMSGVFWSITMNGVRIVICVSFYFWFDFDVYSGVRHDILGYIILFGAIGLIASSDALLGFVLSPVDVSAGSRNVLARIWNRLVAGVTMFNRRTEEVEYSPFYRKLTRGILIGGLVLCNIAVVALFISAAAGNKLTGYQKVGELNLAETDLPPKILGEQHSIGTDGNPVYYTWALVEGSMNNIVRNANSTYGPYSTEWLVQEQISNEVIQVSLDYTFLGWHELKICYRGIGWKVDRVVLPDDEWKSVELHLSRPNGETGYCIFSIFDFDGNPVEPLSDNLGFFLLRLKNRIARELSTTTTFQIQCFFQTFDKLPKERLESVRAMHRQLRERVRETVLSKVNE